MKIKKIEICMFNRDILQLIFGFFLLLNFLSPTEKISAADFAGSLQLNSNLLEINANSNNIYVLTDTSLTIVDVSQPSAESTKDVPSVSTSDPPVDTASPTTGYTWDSKALNGLTGIPENVSRQALLDLVRPGGLKPSEYLDWVSVSRYDLMPDAFIIEMKTTTRPNNGNCIIFDWVLLVSISNLTGEITELARPVNGYIEFKLPPQDFHFRDSPVRIGKKEYAIAFEANFYSPHYYGSEYINTLTLFRIHNGSLLPIVNTLPSYSVLRRIPADETDNPEGEDTYENYTSSTSLEFLKEMTLGLYNIVAFLTITDEGNPKANKNLKAMFTWNGQRYVSKNSVDLLSDASIYIDCPIAAQTTKSNSSTHDKAKTSKANKLKKHK
jgi:hypothetical protein